MTKSEIARLKRRAKAAERAIAAGRKPGVNGRPITRLGKRADYQREWDRRKYAALKLANSASNSPIDSANPTCRTIA